MVKRCYQRHGQILVDGDDLGGSGVFRTQTVAAAYIDRRILHAINASFTSRYNGSPLAVL